MKSGKTFRKQISLTSLNGLEPKISRLLRALVVSPAFKNLPRSLLRDLRLVLMEGVANALRHGKGGMKHPVQVRLIADPKKIEIQIEDRGKGFQFAKALRRQPGEFDLHGRGLLILKNLSDSLTYRRGNPNCLVLVRRLTRPKKLDAAIELFDRLNEAIQQLKSKEFLYDEFIDFIVGLFNVQRASFLIFDRETKMLRVATSRGIAPKVLRKIAIAPGEGVAGYVFQTSRPLLVHQVSGLKKGSPQPRKKGYQTSSFLSVPVIASPLHIGEETIGVLNLTDKRDGSRFTQNELKLLSLMAAQAASAFRIRDLIETVRFHEGWRRELDIVQEIQSRLVPNSSPEVGDLKMAGRCQLSLRGGGDYYDFLQVDGGLRGIIADVSGHDVGSAITMASFRAIFRSLVFDPNSPGTLLRALRWANHRDLISLHQFISCWTFEYYTGGHLKASGAGHPPILQYRKKTRKWVSHYSHHLPLGLEDETAPQNKKIMIERGDWVFFYTDGLFDPRMRDTGFDKDAFCGLVERNLRISPQDLVEKILREVMPHHRILRSPDDIAVVAMTRKG